MRELTSSVIYLNAEYRAQSGDVINHQSRPPPHHSDNRDVLSDYETLLSVHSTLSTQSAAYTIYNI